MSSASRPADAAVKPTRSANSTVTSRRSATGAAIEAACAGVFVHAAAGRLAAAEIGPEGVIASDVIQSLPRALAGRQDR